MAIERKTRKIPYHLILLGKLSDTKKVLAALRLTGGK